MPKILLPIPKNARPVVKVGDKVEVGDLLIIAKKAVELKTLELGKLLRVSPQKAKNLLVLPMGSQVGKGEVIAQKQNLLGLSKTFVFSPFAGSVSFFDDKTGRLFIGEKSGQEEIKSKLDGKISAIGEENLEIETNNETFFGKMGFGPEIEGELIFPTLLDRKVQDKIIMVQELGRLTFSKAWGLGARGVVTTILDSKDLAYFQEKGFKFSLLSVAKDDFMSLKSFIGKKVLLFPEDKMLVIL